jgi:hypothetical protein
MARQMKNMIDGLLKQNKKELYSLLQKSTQVKNLIKKLDTEIEKHLKKELK